MAEEYGVTLDCDGCCKNNTAAEYLWFRVGKGKLLHLFDDRRSLSACNIGGPLRGPIDADMWPEQKCKLCAESWKIISANKGIS